MNGLQKCRHFGKLLAGSADILDIRPVRWKITIWARPHIARVRTRERRQGRTTFTGALVTSVIPARRVPAQFRDLRAWHFVS
ncbi:hypothetical protein EBN03_09895 [Nocardia stercoris]|uniref:Uncharacterized protein n=1 Tax=Nocardia stercoris TaxID=2483361 RepID=A0A3M2L7W2_9NOCA|nr:hypothetical protein EBN03_09895 [Nocardia stercoris]